MGKSYTSLNFSQSLQYEFVRRTYIRKYIRRYKDSTKSISFVLETFFWGEKKVVSEKSGRQRHNAKSLHHRICVQ